MATLLLQFAGSAVGSFFGPAGAIIGRAAGAAIGYAVDQNLFSQTRQIEGPRLKDLDVQASTEGAPIPRVYGRVRIAGQIIWATRYKEHVTTEEQGGGKGGAPSASVTSYNYTANFAIGLCDGVIAGVGRIWADGKLLDRDKYNIRVYHGDENQSFDALLLAKQGDGNVPAYRGTAYIVFEDMELAKFGNRIPQLSFEVFRPVDELGKKLRAVNIIPGSTEFGYEPEKIFVNNGYGSSGVENQHSPNAASDWQASINDLQAVAPNLNHAALVVSWFGDDLRADQCRLKPKVEIYNKHTYPSTWSAAGLNRQAAELTSRDNGLPAYGSTPSDSSVINAIKNLKSRNIKVLFYPFIMMDIVKGNNKPDPYGRPEQPPYPWRGRITSAQSGIDSVHSEIDRFVGKCRPDDFKMTANAVIYSGPDNEWSYRRMILHNAWLCLASGGVERFIIGSELRGLTQIRDSKFNYPFVEHLKLIAKDVRQILGRTTKISYAADWSEYFGHQPQDGSGDIIFHLDPLWSDDNVDFIGIDNYMPLSDWRDNNPNIDADNWSSIYDTAYLKNNITAGEGYDWYYKTSQDRQQQIRTPIIDSAHNENWLFRYKDIYNWWGNFHHNRYNGNRSRTPTGWRPKSKPIFFTEIGCPAIDKGSNQPNLFVDSKSSENGIPYFSTGLSDSLIQRKTLTAIVDYFNPQHEDFNDKNNPLSPIYNGRMVDPDSIYIWTWDARPYPYFPNLKDVWIDGRNWAKGHWLTGRLGMLSTGSLITAILNDFNFHDFIIEDLRGLFEGYIIDRPMAARAAIEPILNVSFTEAVQINDKIHFMPRAKKPQKTINYDELVDIKNKPVIKTVRAQETELPNQVAIGFIDGSGDYRRSVASSHRLKGQSKRTLRADVALVTNYAEARRITEIYLQDKWTGRDIFEFVLPPKFADLTPGDVISLNCQQKNYIVQITTIKDAGYLMVEARAIEPEIFNLSPGHQRVIEPEVLTPPGKPLVEVLDLPLLSDEQKSGAYLAVFSHPWPGSVNIFRKNADRYRFLQNVSRPAIMGKILKPVNGHISGVWDRTNIIEVELLTGELYATNDLDLLNGANLAAIKSSSGQWEVIQFANARLIGNKIYRLSQLLRGQGGTEDVAANIPEPGSRFVLLNSSLVPLVLPANMIDNNNEYQAVPYGERLNDPLTTLFTARAGIRAVLPLSVAHLKAVRKYHVGDITISWIRRARGWREADAWNVTEIPLNEQSEQYEIEITTATGDKIRHLTSNKSSVIYDEAAQISDFGHLATEITITVYQISASYGRGRGANIKFTNNTP